MSTPRDRIVRLEATIPVPRAPYPFDVSRLTPDQMERCARLRERGDLVGMDGLTDQEVEDGAAIEEILVAPARPIPGTQPVEMTAWRTR